MLCSSLVPFIYPWIVRPFSASSSPAAAGRTDGHDPHDLPLTWMKMKCFVYARARGNHVI